MPDNSTFSVRLTDLYFALKVFPMRPLLIVVFVFVLKTVQALDPYPRNDGIDIRHYTFRLELNDSTNNIRGVADVAIRFKKSITSFDLDLATSNSEGKGMTVSRVLSAGESLKFTHQNDRVTISGTFVAGDDKIVTIHYSGIPQDGLIIGKNKFGDRTFFGDNWPNRAHHWLPTIDHPYDKATCEFIVTAPEHYAVIATGEKIEESAIEKKQKVTHWRTSGDIADESNGDRRRAFRCQLHRKC
jgi:aminopeptidase N